MKRPAPEQHKLQGGLEAEVFLSLLRTADALARGAEALLKPHSLSPTQYNVLRILRGSGEQGLACREVSDRLITRDPDITRLLDRLEARGLIARAREAQDRRVVKTRITGDGLRLLAELDQPVRDTHRGQFCHLSEKQLRQLLNLLNRARAPHEQQGCSDDSFYSGVSSNQKANKEKRP